MSVRVLLWKIREREQLEKKVQLGWEHHSGKAYKMGQGTDRHSCRQGIWAVDGPTAKFRMAQTLRDG